jgi:Zn finger protein HypA/HybF involved in hydrogenase expression
MASIAICEEPREYFCRSCRQLRLCLDDSRNSCGHCGSKDLLWGKIGEINKEQELAKCHSI